MIYHCTKNEKKKIDASGNESITSKNNFIKMKAMFYMAGYPPEYLHNNITLKKKERNIK